eukprot:TRINITY_DN812_c0_g1_i1.p1 TRINITY_DN812_c0_g1~~TRINITY_DN812_c0_g1_i1.p1  ORF type:complete len:294 (-),score=44.08 TRINITY_DN812_c0_g1_i1:77-865(-)
MLNVIRAYGGNQVSRLVGYASISGRFQSTTTELTDIMEGVNVAEISEAYKETALPIPPVKLYDQNGKRATYLWQLGQQASKLADIQKDLASFEQKVAADPTFAHFLQDMSKTKKERSQEVAKKMTEIKANTITKDFFMDLSNNNKLRFYPKIFEAFDQLMKTYNKEVQVTIVTSKELPGAQMESAKTLAKQFVPEGANLTFQTRIDPQIIGGMILDMGDQYVDLSVRKKLAELEESVIREHRDIPIHTIMGQVKKKLREAGL